MSTKNKLIISLILIILGISARLLPHAWNVAPIAAIALFAGVYLGRYYALILPPVAMLAGDIFIGFYQWQLALVVYSCFMITGLIGYLISKHKSFVTIVAGSIAGSVIFFILTNWAVWQFSAWYAKDWAGLIQCYTLAIPFFRNTLLGDLFYTSVLFGAYETVKIWLKSRRLALINIKSIYGKIRDIR